jgi:hypothetical protein
VFRVVEYSFTAASVGRLAVGLHNALRNRALVLPDDPDLIDELSNVRIKETSPNTYRLDDDQDQHDDRAISLALCIQHPLNKPQVDIRGLDLSGAQVGVGSRWSSLGPSWRDDPRPA